MNVQIEKRNIIETYRKRAKNYDFTANLYYLIGFREWAYRKRAVAALNLSPGDTVVEIGCGTGLNFPLLQEAVGPTGKIIGSISPMLCLTKPVSESPNSAGITLS